MAERENKGNHEESGKHVLEADVAKRLRETYVREAM